MCNTEQCRERHGESTDIDDNTTAVNMSGSQSNITGNSKVQGVLELNKSLLSPIPDNFLVGRFRASVMTGTGIQDVARVDNDEKGVVVNYDEIKNKNLALARKNWQKSVLKSDKYDQQQQNDSKIAGKADKLHVIFQSKGRNIRISICIWIHFIPPLVKVKTFRIRTESSSSFESVEDLEVETLKGEQQETEEIIPYIPMF